MNAWPTPGSTPSGTGRSARDLAGVLVGRQILVSVLVLEHDDLTWQRPPWRERWRGVDITVVPSPRWLSQRSGYRSVAAEEALLAWLDERRPDLVHVVHPGSAGVGAGATIAAAGYPVVLGAPDAHLACHMGHLINPRIARALCRLPVDVETCSHCMSVGTGVGAERFTDLQEERRLLARASVSAGVVVADSHFVAGELEQALPGTYREVALPVVIPADVAVELPRAPAERLRVGFFGTPTWRKGLDLLLDAFERSGADAELDVFAPDHDTVDPPWAAAVVARARSLPGVRWRGPYDPDAVLALMRSVDVVAVPSRAESLPGVAREALAAGRPVLAAAVAGLPEVVTDEETGWLLPPGDVERWADGLRALAADRAAVRARHQRPGKNGEHAATAYGARLLDLYRQILDGEIPRGAATEGLQRARQRREESPYLRADERYQRALLDLRAGRRWKALRGLVSSLSPAAFDRIEVTAAWVLVAPLGYGPAAAKVRSAVATMSGEDGPRPRRAVRWLKALKAA